MKANQCPVTGAKHACAPAESLAVSAARLAEALEQEVRDFLVASDESLGDIEVQIEQQSRELLRAAAQKAAQANADSTSPRCPVCHQVLSRVTGGHRRGFECKFGTITVSRSRDYCKRCRKWRFAADSVLGLEETAVRSSFGSSSRRWESDLTEAQRRLWVAAAQTVPSHPSLGQYAHLSGHQLWLKIDNTLRLIGKDPITEPPPPVIFGPQPAGDLEAVTDQTGTVRLLLR